jgi:hypothetical protein
MSFLAVTPRRLVAVLLGTTALLFTLGSGAQAATVTIGSPLTTTFPGQYASAPSGTWVNSSLSEPGANVASPVSGTIVRWRIAGNHNDGPFKLRVLRPGPGGVFTGAGTSASVALLPGTQTLSTSLAVQPGDVIGLNGITGSQIPVASVTGSHLINWNPALADGSTSAPPYTDFNNLELGFNADVEYTPPVTTQTKKKCKKKKHKRSAESSKKHKKKGCKKKKKKRH